MQIRIRPDAHSMKNTGITHDTLRTYRTRSTTDSGHQIIPQVLKILRVVHSNGIWHRDVKPNNIILADGKPNFPALVDFGLSNQKVQYFGFTTEDGQEVGNRFLQLPELRHGKREMRLF